MTGRHEEGIEWLEGLCGNWGDVNNFKYHTWWHLALYYLEREDFVKVLDLYDTSSAKSRRTIISISLTQSRCSRVSRCAALISAGVGKNSARFARSTSTTIFSSSTTRTTSWRWLAPGGQRCRPDADIDGACRGRDQHDGGPIFRDVGLPLAALSLPRVMASTAVLSTSSRRCAIRSTGSAAVTRSAISSRNCSFMQQLPMGGIIWRAL